VPAVKKTYESPLRARQAEATRSAVLRAARELFVAHGYGATTIEQIAARAGVSKPTIFTAVGNKQAVLAAVRDVALAGDDEKVAVIDRPDALRIREASDLATALDLLVDLLAEMNSRYAEVDAVLRGAAFGAEPALRDLWQLAEDQRLTGARFWTTTLVAKGALRPGLELDAAVDLMWHYMAPFQYHQLVHVRGWPPERFRRWLHDQLAALFTA
jgi:AcrR family transcriptional regulator